MQRVVRILAGLFTGVWALFVSGDEDLKAFVLHQRPQAQAVFCATCVRRILRGFSAFRKHSYKRPGRLRQEVILTKNYEQTNEQGGVETHPMPVSLQGSKADLCHRADAST